MTVHIKGMGWFGSMTALALEREGIEFTWSDTDSPYQAWRASTGMVYPAGDQRSEINRSLWIRWVLMQSWLPRGSAKLTGYAFAHSRPPHQGKYATVPWLGLRRAETSAVSVNVASIVVEARSRFADRRVVNPGIYDKIIVAHGGDRRVGYVWGWSRKVSFTGYEHAVATALYGKRHRFDLTYAYPVPDEPGWWWAGSALVNEKRPRERTPDELAAQWERWWESAHVLFPRMQVKSVQRIHQGWRPKPAPADEGYLSEGNSLHFPALWHSGVRWAPELIEGAVSWAHRMR